MSCSSRANVFLLVNLGCEMLYVIDQRLKAQHICDEKSIQVIRDITSVLLEPKFIERLILGSQQPNARLITAEHCKIMLNDVACCSLMRLDDTSMDKLWNLMTMIFKWQLFVTKHPQHLLDITFRHLDAVGQIYPDVKRTILVDYTKNTLLDFWNSTEDTEQLTIYRTCRSWLECFNVKISVLIRLGFQALDASFFREVPHSYFGDYVSTAGDNIYTRSVEITEQQRKDFSVKQHNVFSSVTATTTRKVDKLAEMLRVNVVTATTNESGRAEDSMFDEQPQMNIVFEGVQQLDLNTKEASTHETTSNEAAGAFVRLKPSYKAMTSAANSWEDFVTIRSCESGIGVSVPPAGGSKDFHSSLSETK